MALPFCVKIDLMPTCEPHPELVQRATELGNDADIIKSFQRVQGTPKVRRSQDWFFSKNSGLAGATKRPPTTPANWQDWKGLTFQQRIVLGNLGGFDANTVAATDANLAKVTAGYGKWPDNDFAVFWGSGLPDGGTLTPVNTCNVFVGETFFSDGKSLMIGNKYAAAAQIYGARNAQSPLRTRLEEIPLENAQPGDIVAWDFSPDFHVEILSSLNPAASTFCSIGGYREPLGKEVCGRSSQDLARAKGETPTLRFYRWCEQEAPEPGGCGCNPWRFGSP